MFTIHIQLLSPDPDPTLLLNRNSQSSARVRDESPKTLTDLVFAQRRKAVFRNRNLQYSHKIQAAG
jgi:hypothetical protein